MDGYMEPQEPEEEEMKDIDTQRKEMQEKLDHYEMWFATDILGKRSTYYEEVQSKDSTNYIEYREEESGTDS
jgi:hypothetical protein